MIKNIIIQLKLVKHIILKIYEVELSLVLSLHAEIISFLELNKFLSKI